MTRSLWRERDFLLFWGGETVSTLGTSMSGLAFPLLILALTGSPAFAGVAGALRAAPFALLGPVAGTLVDRWDRRQVMLCADGLRALALGSIPLLAAIGRLTLPQLYAVATLEGALLVFYHTAHMASLPRLVGDGRLSQAAAREEATYYGATLAGPPAGGALYSLGQALPFLADALSYALSVLSLALIRTDLGRPTPGPRPRVREDVVDGWRWLWGQPLRRALALLDVPETLVASGLGLLVVVAAQRLHAAPPAIGAIFAVGGVGGILGAALGARLSARWGLGRTIVAVRWAAALLWPCYALAPAPLALGLVTAALFALNPIKNVALVAGTLPLIPEDFRARVVGGWDFLPAMTSSLGAALMGFGLQAIGVGATVAAASAVMLLLAIAATMNQQIRNAVMPSVD